MPNLIDINTDEAEKKVSLFRKYYYEIGFIAMSMVIAYLFVGQKQLERDMRNYLIQDRTTATDVIRQNTDVMKDVKEVLIRSNAVHSNEDRKY